MDSLTVLFVCDFLVHFHMNELCNYKPARETPPVSLSTMKTHSIVISPVLFNHLIHHSVLCLYLPVLRMKKGANFIQAFPRKNQSLVEVKLTPPIRRKTRLLLLSQNVA